MKCQARFEAFHKSDVYTKHRSLSKQEFLKAIHVWENDAMIHASSRTLESQKVSDIHLDHAGHTSFQDAHRIKAKM